MWQLLLGPIGEIVNTVLKRVLPPEKMSEEERAKIEQAVTLELMKQDWQTIAAQLNVNLEEAKSEHLFVSGWRPYIGWVCGTAFAYHFVLQPTVGFLVTLYKWQTPPLPQFDMQTLLTVLLGMLGLGGLRTWEKMTGTNKNR